MPGRDDFAWTHSGLPLRAARHAGACDVRRRRSGRSRGRVDPGDDRPAGSRRGRSGGDGCHDADRSDGAPGRHGRSRARAGERLASERGRASAVDRRDRDHRARGAARACLPRVGPCAQSRVRAALAALAPPRHRRSGVSRLGDLVGIHGLDATWALIARERRKTSADSAEFCARVEIAGWPLAGPRARRRGTPRMFRLGASAGRQRPRFAGCFGFRSGPLGSKIGRRPRVVRSAARDRLLSDRSATMLGPDNSFEWPPATPAQQRRKVR